MLSLAPFFAGGLLEVLLRDLSSLGAGFRSTLAASGGTSAEGASVLFTVSG